MTEQSKIRMLIADDHEIVRSGLKGMMEGTDITVVAEMATGQTAVQYALDNEVDVVLLDIQMPDSDGLVALGRIKVGKPNLPVLMFSAFDNPMCIARAAMMGASGYLLKGCTCDELVKAIKSVAAGQNIWSPDEIRRQVWTLATPYYATDVEVALTQREGEVLRLLASGLMNEQIGKTLHISGHNTVNKHVQCILRKIGVIDRTQAAVWAVRKELAQTEPV